MMFIVEVFSRFASTNSVNGKPVIEHVPFRKSELSLKSE